MCAASACLPCPDSHSDAVPLFHPPSQSEASEQLGTLLPREKHKQAYDKALLERYKHMDEVKRITRHRNLPKPILKATKARRVVIDADKRKLGRRIAHSKPGSIKVKPERKKKILAEVE